MGKKNRNKRNRLEKQRIDSNTGRRCSIAILDVRKESNLEFQRDEDRISSVHDDILSHVISFLPFESAVRTSFLSTRWKYVWKSNSSERKGTIDDAFAAISSFLHGCSDRYSEQRTSNWGFIFNLGKHSFISVSADPCKALQLDFSSVKHGFPWPFDWCLNINGPLCGFWYSNRVLTHEPSSSSFGIKTLHLKSVSHIFSGAISSMMVKFKFLESLTIEKCHGLRSLKLGNGDDSRLKKLTILDCQQLESLHLNYYSLESLRFRGKLLWFQVVYDSFIPNIWQLYGYHHLVDAMLDFRQGPRCRNIGSRLRSFFRDNKYVKSLTLTGWIFEPFIYPIIQSHDYYWDLQFNHLTELWWIDNAKEERFNSNALISFLNFCPRLIRLYITIDPKSYTRTQMSLSNYSLEFKLFSRLKDLKVVKLEGFPNEKEEIRLAKRLKQEFHVQPLIIAKSNYLNCARLMVKADDVYDVQVKEGEDSYKFIEIRVEQLHDVCPKHLHMLI